MAIISRGAALMAGAFLFAAPFSGTSAFAASPVTDAFLANVTPNVDFLDRSSRFALTNTKNARVRTFAFSEAGEQTQVANTLYDRSQAEKALVADAGKLDRTPTGSNKPSGGTPPTAPKASQGTKGVPETLADDRLPMGQEELDSLEGLEGSAFDAQYKEKQLEALRQIETDYRDYAVKGDDPGLRAFATRELPKVRRRLAQIDKI